MVIKPFAFEPSTAKAMADDAIKIGSSIAIEQVMDLECTNSTCQTIKTAAMVTSLATNEDHQLTLPTTNLGDVAPVPPPRPARYF